MNAEMAEQENKETSEVKNETSTDESQVDGNQTVSEEKTEKKVEANSAAVSNLRLHSKRS